MAVWPVERTEMMDLMEEVERVLSMEERDVLAFSKAFWRLTEFAETT